VRNGELVPVELEGAKGMAHWVRPEALEDRLEPAVGVHILSPFDPLVIQRRRLHLFFDYEHRFEAYLPKARRKLGYFAQPVLVDGTIAAVIDLKTDREGQKLLMQRWTWVTSRARQPLKRRIEETLHRFERFQLER
jgi:uncharacterized protein YcaQ